MKKHTLLLALATLLPISVVHASPYKANFAGCTPANTYYFSYTEKGTKAVELCRVAGGYRYTFGPINKPEIQLVKKPGEAGAWWSGQMQLIAVRNGNIIYHVESTGPGGFESLVVTKGKSTYGGKDLAKIPLAWEEKYPHQYNLHDIPIVDFND